MTSPRPNVALGVASAGTGLVLLVFASVVTTVAPTVAALHAGAIGETWALSGMSLGLAAMLLSLGAAADDYGRRRVFRAVARRARWRKRAGRRRPRN